MFFEVKRLPNHYYSMAKPISHSDLVWGYGAQLLNVGTGILLLPVVLHFMSPADVGLWIVFVTLGSLAQLLEFGFQPTIARNVAYVFAGAKTLVNDGIIKYNATESQINSTLLVDLVVAARKIYRTIALVASLLLFTAGTFYITTLITPDQNYYNTLLGWCAFSLGYSMLFYFGYINGLLQGRGDVTKANKIVIIQRLSFLLLGIAFALIGWGLLGLGIASMLSALLGRIAAIRYINMTDSVLWNPRSLNQQSVGKLQKILWHNASRLGTVQLGAFLINRSSILIASSALGVAASAKYSLTLTILLALSSASSVIAQINVPHLSSMQLRNERDGVVATYKKIVLISFFTYTAGFVLIAAFGNLGLELIRSNVTLIPIEQLLLLGVILILEMHHSVAATVLTTWNSVPFVPAALISGLAILILSLLLVNSCGPIGLIISQGAVQLAYNNWKWPLEILKKIGARPREIYLLHKHVK